MLARITAGTCALLAGLGAAIALAASGGLDPSFGTGGTVVLDRPTETYPTPAAVMPGGKIVLVTTANDKVVVSRLLSNGAPDPTFDNDGQAVIQAAHALRGYAVAIEPDGKIIVAGSMGNSLPGTDAAVWRLKADGGSGSPNSALDPTFDADGVALIDSTQEEYAEAVGIQPDGRIVIAGRTYNSPGPANVGVWRLLPDGGTGAVNGALDDSFDTDGAAGIGDGGYDDAQGLALQPDGKILVAGESDIDAPARNAVVWRLQANGGPGGFNGALDTTFDTDGRASINAGGDEVATGIALAPDGKVVVSGRTSSAPNGSAAIVWRGWSTCAGSGVRHQRRRPGRQRRLRPGSGGPAAARRQDPSRGLHEGRHEPGGRGRLAAGAATGARVPSTMRWTRRSAPAAPSPWPPIPARAWRTSCSCPIAGSSRRAHSRAATRSCSACWAIRSR